jgi:hypothetical protein
MKSTLLICLCSIALALNVCGQTATPIASGPSPQSGLASSAAPAYSATVAPTPNNDAEDPIERALKKHMRKHFNFSMDGFDKGSHGDMDSDLMAIPIVGIVFTTLFGAPVMVVAAVMFFSYLKSRSLHRTVRTMVEKGQEVPAALFAPPPVIRARSDLRRGVVLLMVGFGLMIFFGAVNDWEGGSWSLGVIPFLIGLGYLMVWKLERPKDKAPPLP